MADKPELTPAQRAMRAKVASHTSWAKTADRAERTAAARRNSPTSRDYWLDRVPDDITDPKARAKAAESAHKAHMSRLALRSSQARAAKKTATPRKATR